MKTLILTYLENSLYLLLILKTEQHFGFPQKVMNYAPIAIFCYERLNHLDKLIQALQKSPLLEESEVFIFIDGPKDGNTSSVEKVQDYVQKLNIGLRKHVFKRNKNIGLSKSIISGVNQVLDRNDRVIVF